MWPIFAVIRDRRPEKERFRLRPQIRVLRDDLGPKYLLEAVSI